MSGLSVMKITVAAVRADPGNQGDLRNYTFAERFLRGQRKEGHQTIVHPVNFPETLAVESILVKRCTLTQGRALGQAKCGLKAR